MKEVFEKIIEKLEEEKSKVPVNRVLDDIIKDKPKELGQLMAYSNSVKIVKQVAEEYNNGWIPVSSENLPRENEDVLMVIEYADGEVIILEQTFYKCLLDTPGLMVKYWQPEPKLPLEYQPKGDKE